MVFRWRDNHTELFLTFYREYEFLWDITNPLYKNRLLRRSAYRKIVERMNVPNLTEYDVKSKIKTIRTNYKYELNKLLKEQKRDPHTSYTPHLFWFKKADEFLRNVSGLKKFRTSCLHRPADNISDTNNEDNEADSFSQYLDIKVENPDADDVVVDTDSDCKSESIPPLPTKMSNNEMSLSILNSAVTENRSPVTLNPPLDLNISVAPTNISSSQPSRPMMHVSSVTLKHKRASSRLIELEKRVNKLQKAAYQDEEDEFDLFGRSIALQLKRMPLERAFVCQENLQRVMIQERLRHLNGAQQ